MDHTKDGLGKKLWTARQNIGLTRTQVVVRTGIDHGSLRAYEFGYLQPSCCELMKLKELYGLKGLLLC